MRCKILERTYEIVSVACCQKVEKQIFWARYSLARAGHSLVALAFTPLIPRRKVASPPPPEQRDFYNRNSAASASTALLELKNMLRYEALRVKSGFEENDLAFEQCVAAEFGRTIGCLAFEAVAMQRAAKHAARWQSGVVKDRCGRSELQ